MAALTSVDWVFTENPGRGKKMRATIIGAGVNALTSAILLQQNGFQVSVVAKGFLGQTTTTVAGALWEMPPAVCGLYEPVPAAVAKREIQWAVSSYQRFKELYSKDRRSGVFMRPVVFYLKHNLIDDDLEGLKFLELSECVDGLIHEPDLVQEQQNSDYVDAYRYVSPQIDTDVYLAYLYEVYLNGGGDLCCQSISDLGEEIDNIQDQYKADLIVNCSGLGACQLVPDGQVVPVRGAWFSVRNDGTQFPKVDTAFCASQESWSSDGVFMFVLPRGETQLVMGGIAQPNQWDTELSRNSPEIHKMLELCFTSFPFLREADFENASFRVGLRPFRAGGVRLDLDTTTYPIPVISNYGHGGAGVFLSWGCALDVLKLANEVKESALSKSVVS